MVSGNFLKKPIGVCLLAAVSCLLWGSAAPMIKIGYEQFGIAGNETWRIILFAGCRFALAGLLVITFSSMVSKKPVLPKKTSWGPVALLGLFQTVLQYMLYYIGVAHASGVHSAILSGAGSLWSILLACLLFRQEKMTITKLAGCLLAFGGIIVMNLSGAGGGVTFLGEGFLLLSGASNGVASGLTKIYSKDESPVTLTGWQFLLGGLFMCVCAFAMGARLTVSSAAAAGVLLYLGFLSAVAYTLWTVLIKHNTVSTVSVYGFMTPMFGVVISAVLLGEAGQALSLNTIAALAMVCAGIVLVNKFGNRTKSLK